MGEDGRRRLGSGLGISCLDRMVSGQSVTFDPERGKKKIAKPGRKALKHSTQLENLLSSLLLPLPRDGLLRAVSEEGI